MTRNHKTRNPDTLDLVIIGAALATLVGVFYVIGAGWTLLLLTVAAVAALIIITQGPP